MKFLDIVGLGYSWEKYKNYFQTRLISGTNIKTINGRSLLGAGDLQISIDAAQVSWDSLTDVPSWIANQQLSWDSLTDVPSWIANQQLSWDKLSNVPGWITNRQFDWNNIINKPDFSTFDGSRYVQKSGDTISGTLTFEDYADIVFKSATTYDSILINSQSDPGTIRVQASDQSYIQISPTGITSSLQDPGSVFSTDGGTINISDILSQIKPAELTGSVGEDSITLHLESNSEVSEVEIGTATESQPGLMTSGDKQLIEAIKQGDKPLVTPSIQPSWVVHSSTGTQNKTDSSLILENGYTVDFNGTYRWTHNNSYKDPTFVDTASSAWSDLPASGVTSQAADITGISGNRTIKIRIGAPKQGLMVSGSAVVVASGNDYTESSCSVSFRHRIYTGAVTTQSPTAEDIRGLSSALISSRSYTINNVTTSLTQYFVIAYPKALGNISSIIQDGSMPVLGAFKGPDNLNITNDAGAEIAYLVYVSQNPGAFTNVQLAIK